MVSDSTLALFFFSLQLPSFALEFPHEICAVFSLSQFYISTLVYYLPNLEDLTARNLGMSVGDDAVVFQASTSPPFTGTLTISSSRRIDRLVTRLLSLPNGIHFRKFKFLWEVETDVQWVMDLVEACSDTLEHFDLEPRVKGRLHYPWLP